MLKYFVNSTVIQNIFKSAQDFSSNLYVFQFEKHELQEDSLNSAY